MALAFEVVQFDTGISPAAVDVEQTRDVTFPGKIREDADGNPVIDVAIRSYSFAAYVNGQPEDWELGGQTLRLEVSRSGHTSGQITLRMNMRPRLSEVRNPAYQFKGTVEALVMADLV
ncbi:hypothetical protein ACFQ0X_14755 [Streptomyces rectiviolaceus]|uniref:Uncharacterized protein n=1 Tax=Streptomyces rectiviolaceus TaxID=332591 RepID=A0ABP6M596_9ACTN